MFRRKFCAALEDDDEESLALAVCVSVGQHDAVLILTWFQHLAVSLSPDRLTRTAAETRTRRLQHAAE